MAALPAVPAVLVGLGTVLLAGCGAPRAAPRATPTDAYFPVAREPVRVGIDLGAPLEPGCFAWSERERAVACVTGEESAQSGGRYEVTFVGSETAAIEVAQWEPGAPRIESLVLSPDARSRVEERLRANRYVALAMPAISVVNGSEAVLPGTTIRVACRRQTLDRIETDEGAWDVLRDSIVLLDASGRETTVMSEELEGAADRPARVRLLPDARHVLVEVEAQWGIEGDVGRGFAAYVAPSP